MQRKMYTVEELMLDDSFLSYCLHKKAADRAFWNREIELHAEQKAIFAEAKYTIILLHGELSENEVNEQVEKIKNLINSRQGKHSSGEKIAENVSTSYGIPGERKSKKYALRAYAMYSMAALLLIFLGGYLFKYAAPKATTPASKSLEVSYYSGVGERKSIALPDGSVAVINSNSSITLKGDFNQKERSVLLSGEAFFNVAKNPAKPFIVHSGTFSVTALGTSFYVHARNKENNYKVDLLEGRVKLTSRDDKRPGHQPFETTLSPGEEGAWQTSRTSFIKTFIDSAALKNWVAGRLSFKNMDVEKVMEMLRQWYGVDIIIKHRKWSGLTLTGDYDNKPLDHVLKIICFSLSAGYSYSATQVIIE